MTNNPIQDLLFMYSYIEKTLLEVEFDKVLLSDTTLEKCHKLRQELDDLGVGVLYREYTKATDRVISQSAGSILKKPSIPENQETKNRGR